MRAKGLMRSALAGLVLAVASGNVPAIAEEFTSPDILVLGDSQISFGSGPVFVDFLSQLDTVCAPSKRQSRALKQLGEMKVGVIGVRSTSIHSWTARKGAAKGSICNIDKKWKVNAGTYGVVNKTGNEFKQMGQGRNYQFCSAGKSSFEVMFRDDYYAPKLLVLAFLGNASRRWAEQPELALADVRKLGKQLPPDLPCVFMTTAPAHTTKVSKQRARAQENIKKAFEKTGNRCAFVEGITPETIAANQSTPSFFRRSQDGRVKDPYHPNEKGARHHFKQRAPALCAAIFDVLERKPNSS